MEQRVAEAHDLISARAEVFTRKLRSTALEQSLSKFDYLRISELELTYCEEREGLSFSNEHS
jgi:hypothetical protein